MMQAIANPDAISSSTVITAKAVVSSSIMGSGMICETNGLEMRTSSHETSSTVVKFNLLDSDGWSVLKEGRFNVLSRKEVSGQISVEELVELDALTRRRRQEKYPRTADEILWQRRQQNVTRNLLQALQDYVHFHEPSHHT